MQIPLIGLVTVVLLSVGADGQEQSSAYGTVVGTVIDTLGKRVPNAEVWLSESQTGTRIAQTKTSNGGMFIFRKVPFDKTFSVRVTAPGRVVGDAQVSLSKEQMRGTVSIRLWDATVISGRVVDAKGQAVAGAQVCAAFDSARGYGFEPQGETITDKEGCFVLPKIPLGDITVRAAGTGRVMATKQVYLRDRAEVELTLERGQGTTLDLRVEGVEGKAAKGIRVGVLSYARGHQVLPSSLVKGVTDANASWKVQGLPDMKFRVFLQGEGMSFAPRELVFEPGTGPHHAVFKAHLDAKVMLRGRVVGPDGKALVGETLLCRASNGGRRSTAVTDEKGHFEMQSPLSPGSDCVFYVTDSSYVLALSTAQKDSVFLRSSTRRYHRAVVQTQENYSFKAIPCAKVRGRLIAKDGNPLPFQSVGLAFYSVASRRSKWKSFVRTTSDRRGYFVFRAVRAIAGSLRVETAGAVGLGNSEPFELEAGKVHGNVVLSCDAPASISGVVLDSKGAPLPGARVWLLDFDPDTGRRSSGSVAEVYTDREGRFCHLGVAPVGHKLQVRVRGHRRAKIVEEGGELFLCKPGVEIHRKLQLR